jgi:hypothetical protein
MKLLGYNNFMISEWDIFADILQIGSCFSGADDSKIAYCVPASASDLALRATTGQDLASY